MTEAAWIGVAAVIASVATLVTAIGAVIVGIRTSRKADALITKTEAIHVSTNSHLKLVTDNLAAANLKIDDLRKASDEKIEKLQLTVMDLLSDHGDKKPSAKIKKATR